MAENIYEEIEELKLWRSATQMFLAELVLALKEADAGVSASMARKLIANRNLALEGGNNRLAAILGQYANVLDGLVDR